MAKLCRARCDYCCTGRKYLGARICVAQGVGTWLCAAVSVHARCGGRSGTRPLELVGGGEPASRLVVLHGGFAWWFCMVVLHGGFSVSETSVLVLFLSLRDLGAGPGFNDE